METRRLSFLPYSYRELLGHASPRQWRFTPCQLAGLKAHPQFAGQSNLEGKGEYEVEHMEPPFLDMRSHRRDRCDAHITP